MHHVLFSVNFEICLIRVIISHTVLITSTSLSPIYKTSRGTSMSEGRWMLPCTVDALQCYLDASPSLWDAVVRAASRYERSHISVAPLPVHLRIYYIPMIYDHKLRNSTVDQYLPTRGILKNHLRWRICLWLSPEWEHRNSICPPFLRSWPCYGILGPCTDHIYLL